MFGRIVQPLGLTIIEWYILRALYERDGQHASELARAVGRAATSFTPNLDKLQGKGFVERRPDPADRRAVRIFLTDKALDMKTNVVKSAKELDQRIRQLFEEDNYEVFHKVVSQLQMLEPNYSEIEPEEAQTRAKNNGKTHGTKPRG
ncbi:MAG: MarR family transcriptional regulator [Chloroflexota bacterium]|nr:MarR family transcriptional regulator [Chloroflexota bacterium]